jgi:hypothetical protein
MKEILNDDRKKNLKRIVRSKRGYIADFAERGKIVIFSSNFEAWVTISKVTPWTGASAKNTAMQSIKSALGPYNKASEIPVFPEPYRCVKRID